MSYRRFPFTMIADQTLTTWGLLKPSKPYAAAIILLLAVLLARRYIYPKALLRRRLAEGAVGLKLCRKKIKMLEGRLQLEPDYVKHLKLTDCEGLWAEWCRYEIICTFIFLGLKRYTDTDFTMKNPNSNWT